MKVKIYLNFLKNLTNLLEQFVETWHFFFIGFSPIFMTKNIRQNVWKKNIYHLKKKKLFLGE
jgi:hypothetical protein